jgi:hypothetical protein
MEPLPTISNVISPRVDFASINARNDIVVDILKTAISSEDINLRTIAEQLITTSEGHLWEGLLGTGLWAWLLDVVLELEQSTPKDRLAEVVIGFHRLFIETPAGIENPVADLDQLNKAWKDRVAFLCMSPYQ